MEDSSIPARLLFRGELCKGDYDYSNIFPNISDVEKWFDRKFDWNFGDIIAFSEDRDMGTYLIGKNGVLVPNEDFSGSGGLTIPYEITQYLDNAVEKYNEFKTEIRLRHDDLFIKENYGDMKEEWDFIYLYWGNTEEELCVTFPNIDNFYVFEKGMTPKEIYDYYLVMCLINEIKNSKTESTENTVKMLIEAGANVNLQDNEGWTALMYASRNSNTKSTENTVKMLIEAGANVNLQNNNGNTALMFASEYSNTKSTENTVKMLIEAGANVNLQDNEGWTALMYASRNSNTKSTENTVKMLIEAGANVNLQNNEGWTPLILSSRNSNAESTEDTVKMLIEAGANVNLQNDKGYTALMAASANTKTGSTENTVKLLIEAGANVNLQNNEGYTALRIASMNSNTRSTENTIKILIEAGANVNLSNKVIIISDENYKDFYSNPKTICSITCEKLINKKGKLISNIKVLGCNNCKNLFEEIGLKRWLIDNSTCPICREYLN